MAALLLFYIRFLAKIQLFKQKLLNENFKIVGISGSAGKTSTMMALYAILKDHYKCKYSYKANSETGIPLDILGLHVKSYSKLEWLKLVLLAVWQVFTYWQRYDIYIVEMGVDGINEPKNMRYLLRILVPDVAIYLNVTATHYQNYENSNNLTKEQIVDLIAQDKNLLVASLPANGLAVLNADDARVYDSKNLAKCSVTLVSLKDKVEIIDIPKYILPVHYQYTFNLAIAAAAYFNIDRMTAIKELQKNFEMDPGRSSLFEGLHNSTIIDSSYNSSKEPLLDMIDLLNDFSRKNHSLRIAVLGEMRELGSASQSEHEEVARLTASKVDKFFLVGEDMKKWFMPELSRQKYNVNNVVWFETASQCAAALSEDLAKIEQHKTVLVKGSQNKVFLEIVVEKLLLHQSDKEKLCRRGEFWDQKRKGF